MGSGGYIKTNYQNIKLQTYNYTNLTLNDTIIEETNEETNEEMNQEINEGMNDYLSDDSYFELINDRDYQKDLCKEFLYIIDRFFIFLNCIINKIFKIKK